MSLFVYEGDSYQRQYANGEWQELLWEHEIHEFWINIQTKFTYYTNLFPHHLALLNSVLKILTLFLY